MNKEVKISNTKKRIKNLINVSAMYTIMLFVAIFDTILITPNENVSIFSNTMIILYSLTLLSSICLVYNIIRYHNEDMVRKKAIHDYDERNEAIQNKTDTYTLHFIYFSLVVGLIVGVYFDSIEIFSLCFILILLILISHIIIKLLVSRNI